MSLFLDVAATRQLRVRLFVQDASFLVRHGGFLVSHTMRVALSLIDLDRNSANAINGAI